MILIGRGLNLGKAGAEELERSGGSGAEGAEAGGREEKKLVLRDSMLCSCEGV